MVFWARFEDISDRTNRAQSIFVILSYATQQVVMYTTSVRKGEEFVLTRTGVPFIIIPNMDFPGRVMISQESAGEYWDRVSLIIHVLQVGEMLVNVVRKCSISHLYIDCHKEWGEYQEI